jgi:peptide/nickel transport system substrate-binding protein
MISRAFKLRFRRRLRMRKLQVEEFGQQAERQLERNFFRRLERLNGVRRFVSTWIILVILIGACVTAQIGGLRGYYQAPSPVAGGTYSEGILGTFTNANPIYATSPVDVAASKLLFAGLLTYDENNNLTGDLAKDWSVDARGTLYTVHLRPNLTWHDGKPLTAEDVAFTYSLIQNPDARSPLNPSWQGIEVNQIDPLTVTFKLPNLLSAFPYSLTNGILPKHILKGKSMGSLRTLPFNTTEPVGAGPFKFSTLEVTGGTAESREEQIALDAFDEYHAGRPKLDRFVIHSFRSQDRIIKSFQSSQINAMVGLTGVPNQVKKTTYRSYNLPLTAAVMTFFKTTEGVLSDVKVRQALVKATDTSNVIKSLDYPALPVREPLLQNQLGYNAAYWQSGFDLPAANALLEQEGWKMGANGIRHKDGQALSFSINARDNSEYARIAKVLQKQWKAVGVDVKLILEGDTDFQSTLANHSYDALLYGISIGKDPDVFVYWDSKYADVRADNRLNFSEYKSPTADAALQAGRTRSDPALRSIKYQPFLQAWRDDAPAVGLYQPRFLYITHGPVYGLSEHSINADVERFTNVQNWMVREKGVSQTRQ